MVGALFLMLSSTPMYRGADASFVPQYRSVKAQFSDAGKQGDALEIMARRGVNLLRLRLWNEPKEGWCDLAQTIAMAKDAKRLGMKVLLDFHYSDDWADPQHQVTPRAWQGLDADGLARKIEQFTLDSLRAMAKEGVPPAAVQIGNEVRDGMCWPVGQISKNGYGPFCNLLKAGIRAARKFDPKMPVMVHYDQGGSWAKSEPFYRAIQQQGVSYDWIGLSYYPWWHGSLDGLRKNLTKLNAEFSKPIMIVECAYPWTLKWNDDTGNFVGETKQLEPGYPATPEGQAMFLAAVRGALARLPKDRNLGVCWWAPEYIAVPEVPTPYENLTLFDFEGRALPGLAALGKD